MRVVLSTGGFRDFLQLIPETVEECTELSRISANQFVDTKRMFLNLGERVMRLQVWMSEQRTETIEESAAIRAAHDAEP